MKKLNFKKKVFALLIMICSIPLFAQTEKTATPGNANQIVNWAKDGVTKKIIVPAGTYNFTVPIAITNNGLTIQGANKNNTIFKLTAKQPALIDAKGNNAVIKNLTLNGMDNQKTFGNSIFRFNKSKGHRIINVIFKNSLWDGIGTVRAYPTHGLFAKNCTFTNIDFIAINIFNRNTNSRGGNVITAVDRITINLCTFNEGYEIGVTSDCGNDRQNLNNTSIGPRYRQSTSLSGTVIKNCTFKRTKKFHIAMVQSSNMIIQDNVFEGVTEVGNPQGAENLHFEQFSNNIEIYDNQFFMSNNLERKYNYILFGGTEGHKRVSGNNSTNPADWRFKVNGSNERRADTGCATEGDSDGLCKRDHHSYGARNIYIAGNTFNSSTKIAKYITMKEAEGMQIGKRKGGTVDLNDFKGGNNNTKKISMNGNHKGTCGVIIQSGQNIVANNVTQGNVHFGVAACRIGNRNKIGNTNIPGVTNTDIKTIDVSYGGTNELLSVFPNPASHSITLRTNADYYTATISDISGSVVKTIKGSNESSKTIDIDNISPGIYILALVSNDGRSEIEKLIVN